jgi:surface polysaccharide O-acyltransferase-like enzyme
MMSGALLLNNLREETPALFLRRRLRRILIPYLFATSLYVLWLHLFKNVTMTPLSILGDFLCGSGFYHLWFFPMIIGLYLLTPMLRVFVEHAPVSVMRFTIGVVLGLASAYAFFHDFFGLTLGQLKTNFIFFIPSFLLGSQIMRSTGRYRPGLWIGLLWISGLGMAAGDYFVVRRFGFGSSPMPYFSDPTNFYSVFMAAAFFIIVVKLNVPTWLSRMLPPATIRQVADATLGIYILHPLFLNLLQNGAIFIPLSGLYPLPTRYGLPLTAIIAFLMSMIVVLIVKKIPWIREVF